MGTPEQVGRSYCGRLYRSTHKYLYSPQWRISSSTEGLSSSSSLQSKWKVRGLAPLLTGKRRVCFLQQLLHSMHGDVICLSQVERTTRNGDVGPLSVSDVNSTLGNARHVQVDETSLLSVPHSTGPIDAACTHQVKCRGCAIA